MPFVEYGKGTPVVPESPWEARVLEDAIIWEEYGMPFDPRTRLSRREYHAHLAVIEGKQKARKRRQKELERET